MSEQALRVETEKSEPLADGIYFDLDEERYHLDPALGSSDIRKLLDNPCDFYWESWMNPKRPKDSDTPARKRGRAMHKLVLEGADKFHERYLRGPDHPEDAKPAEKAAATKAVNAKAAISGHEVLPADVFDRIVIAGAMISKNPKLAGAFTGGEPEVSVFWTRDDVRRKARFDYLKPRGIGDLKSIENTMAISFPAACRRNIAQYRYEIQAAHYLEARSQLPDLVLKQGAVWLDDNDRPDRTDFNFLTKCADEKNYAFQWVFFQASSAPVTWSRVLSPKNPIAEIARREIDAAVNNYKAFMDRFGPDQMWVLEEDPEELSFEEMPGWFGRQ